MATIAAWKLQRRTSAKTPFEIEENPRRNCIEADFVQLLKQYDYVRCLVDQANDIFGLLMAMHHSLVFFFACCLTLASPSKSITADASKSISFFIGLVSVLAFSVIMTSLTTGQMERASRRLPSRLSSFSSQN